MIARGLRRFSREVPCPDPVDCGWVHRELVTFPCSVPGCRNPSSGWAYSTMSDGQTIDGRAVCLVHMVEAE